MIHVDETDPVGGKCFIFRKEKQTVCIRIMSNGNVKYHGRHNASRSVDFLIR